MLGAADIARKALLPAISASRNGELVALASRSPERAHQMLLPYPGARVVPSYEALLAQPDIDAVYIPLVNSLHPEWTVRALEAGKHVLCEKPLAMNAREAEAMAAAASHSGRLLMEAFMYRFHPDTRTFVESVHQPLHVEASFGFTLTDTVNYRMQPELGGGALLDVGCYTVSVARWILGEPIKVHARARKAGGVDMTVAALMEFSGGRTASIFASFESPEVQQVRAIGSAGVQVLDRPFTAWHDPWDPYQLMVESFADSILLQRPVEIPLEESIANMRALDSIRAAFVKP